MTTAKKTPPWKKKAPARAKGAKAATLTEAEKRRARARAKKAGRRYPNLVDNMNPARAKKRKARKR
jgi:hypothetical protein